jgi:hypothetical protein
LSKTSSSGLSGSLGSQKHHKRNMAKETLTHRMKDKTRRVNINKIIPRNQLRRVMGSLRKTPESGVSSTKVPSTTLMNVSRNIHWWTSSKKNN